MEAPMALTRRIVRDLLGEFRRETFRIDHHPGTQQTIAQECKEIADQVLKEKFHYHFHKLPDADRAEIINMIHNYTTEALLPPILTRITRRQVVLERKLGRVVDLLERTLEAMAGESPEQLEEVAVEVP
jgi:hypothetical protein